MIPRIQVLHKDQLHRLHDATMEVLQETGLIIKNKRAREIFLAGGAKVLGEKVFIPASLMEWGLSKAPSTFTLYNQRGEEALKLGQEVTYFGSGPTTPYLLDPLSGERRKVTQADVRMMVSLVDSLEQIDFVMSMGLISDAPPGTEDLYEFRELLLGTDKPLCSWGYNEKSYETIRDMAALKRGSLESIREKPFYILYSEPTTPLLQTHEALDKVIFMAENFLPFVHTSGAAAGGVAPVTLAGLMVVSSAEVMSGILLAQLINPGTPCLFGYATHIMDMKTAVCSYGCPELALGQVAVAEQANYYGIPAWGYAGCSDAKVVDGQLSLESAIHNLMSILSKAHFVHDVGFMESGMVSSPSSLVLNNEILSLVKRIRKGINTNDEALAIDVIKEIGPQGNFLTHPHTLEHFKETFYPDLINRQNYQQWEQAGKRSLEDRLREKTLALLHTQKPLGKRRKDLDQLLGAKFINHKNH